MITGDRIYVIEPHADDAFLSLGWSIGQWVRQDRAVEVVTVSADEARAEESRRWAESVGAGWCGLGLDLPETDWLAKATEGTPALPTPLLPASMMSSSACRIWPLGVQHPHHVMVAGSAPDGDLRYLDTPYQVLWFTQAQLRERLVGRTIEWWLLPPRRKWQDSRFFPSQSLLFEQFTPDLLGVVPEVIVR